jgi:hypothetical protein
MLCSRMLSEDDAALGPGEGELTQDINGSLVHNRVQRQKVECEEAERSQTDLVLGFVCQELRKSVSTAPQSSFRS